MEQAEVISMLRGMLLGGFIVGCVWVARDLLSPLGRELARVRGEMEKARRDNGILQAVNAEGRRMVDWALEKLACVREENDHLETALRLAREHADKVDAEKAELHEKFMQVSASLETQARENTAQAAIIGQLRTDLEAALTELVTLPRSSEQLNKRERK
jgi:ABC-type phosphate transport system auxiliary subunit